MTDFEKLVAQTQNALCVEEETKKITYYNCFGDKIDEYTNTISTVFVFDKSKGAWVRGIKGNEE